VCGWLESREYYVGGHSGETFMGKIIREGNEPSYVIWRSWDLHDGEFVEMGCCSVGALAKPRSAKPPKRKSPG
jgi:hypothetical protein